MSGLSLDVGLALKLKQAFERNNWTLQEIDQLCRGDMLGDVRHYLRVKAEEIEQVEKKVFTLTTGDGRSPKQLFKAGSYDWAHAEGIKEFLEGDKFSLASKAAKMKIVLIGFQYNPSTEDVLAEFARRGFERPTEEDALRFGEKYPNEQIHNTIVFLHQHLFGPPDKQGVLALTYHSGEYGSGGRGLFVTSLETKWPQKFFFAARRPQLK